MPLDDRLALHAHILTLIERLAAHSTAEEAAQLRADAKRISLRVPGGVTVAMVPEGPPDPGHHG